MAKKFTKQDLDLIRSNYNDGLTLKEICEKHFPSRKHDSICWVARKHGISKPKDFWSKEDDDILRSKIDSGLSHLEASKFFPDRTWIAVRRRADEIGAASKYHFKKYSSNDNFWDEFSPINCYWAGFIAADGCIVRGGNGEGYAVNISLQAGDKNHLKMFGEHCSSTCQIFTYDNTINARGTVYSRIVIHNKNWQKSLEEKFNLFKRKTFTFKMPELPSEMVPYWIAGYIDGDGCYTISKECLCVGVISAVKETTQFIMDFLNKFPRVKGNRPKIRLDRGKYYTANVSGMSAVHAAHYLMSLPCPHLERKYNKVRNYLLANPKYNLSLPPYEEKLAQLTTTR